MTHQTLVKVKMNKNDQEMKPDILKLKFKVVLEFNKQVQKNQNAHK